MPRLSLNAQILLGALIGILLGLFLQTKTGTPASDLGVRVAGIVGGLFIDLLKMVLIPLVFTSIAVGIANLRAHDQMHRVWTLALAYFVTTTALAILLGITMSNAFKPGVGLNLHLFEDALQNFDAQHLTLQEFLTRFLHSLFMNPLAAMAQGEVLPTVIFALILGIALVVSGEKSRTLLNLLAELLDLIMWIVGWIMRIAPFGVLALLAKLIATQSPELFTTLGTFVGVVLGSTLFHGFFVLPCLLYLLTRVTPRRFFPKVKEAMVTAFATSSSSATLPVSMTCVEHNLKVDGDIAGFVLPLGATINMDGTALYEAAAALFIANLVGVELSLLQQLIVFFMAIVASIGAPGIPSAGMVTMVMVLQSVGLPAEAIGILLPLDRLLDAFRTMINVEGDMVGSLIVEKLAKRPSAF